MNRIKIEVEVPAGNFCDGCPLKFEAYVPQGGVILGCNYLHCELKMCGMYKTQTLKPKECPSNKVVKKGEVKKCSKT